MTEIMKELSFFGRASLKFQYYWAVKHAALVVKFLPKYRIPLVYYAMFFALIELSKNTGIPISLIFEYFNNPKNNSSASLIFFRYFSHAANAARSFIKENEIDLIKNRGFIVNPNSRIITGYELEKGYRILASVFGVVISPEKVHRLRPIFQKLYCSIDSVMEAANQQRTNLWELCQMDFCCDEYLVADYTDADLRDLKDILPMTPKFLNQEQQ